MRAAAGTASRQTLPRRPSPVHRARSRSAWDRYFRRADLLGAVQVGLGSVRRCAAQLRGGCARHIPNPLRPEREHSIHHIRVIAINTAGFASQPSAAATATTPALPAGYENPPGSVNQIWVFPTTSLRPDGFQLFWYKPAAADADAYYAQWKSGTQDWDTSRQKLKLDCRTPYCTLDIRNLNGGTEYTVRVASVKGAYNLDTSQFTPSSDLSRPSPELVVTTPPYGEGTTTVTARSTYLEVTWDSSAGATHYELQWKSGDQGFDPGARGIVVFATDGPLVGSVITGLTPETEYTVRVIAFIDVHGDGSAYDRSYLVPVTATTTALVAGEVEPPAQVQGLTSLSSGVTTTQIQIRWDSTPNADGYIVQWKSYPQQYSDTERRAVIACDTDCQSSPTQTYAITGLAIGSEIEIQVTATRAGAINGTPSLILKVGTRPEGPPGNLRIWTNAGTVGLLEVAWNEVRGAASYRVQWVAPEESFDQSPPVHEEIKVGVDKLLAGPRGIRRTEDSAPPLIRETREESPTSSGLRDLI